MIDTAPHRLTLRQRWHRLRTSPRFPYLLFLGLLVAGALSQVYYYWWAVRIERFFARCGGGSVERIEVYPPWVKQYLGWQFVARFEPIRKVSLRFDMSNNMERRSGDLRLFRGMFFLRELDVYGRLTADDVKHLKCLTQLRTVRCWFHPESVLDGVEKLPKLTILSLYFEDAPEPMVFTRLTSMPQLERLNLTLGFRGRGPKTVKGLSELAKSQSLHRLETQLYREEFLALTSLLPNGSPPLPSLNELRIAGSRKVNPQDLDNLKHIPNLVHLDLSYSEITDAHVPYFKGLPYLRTLYVEANPGITDEGAKRLASMHNLQSLNVKRTGITNEGLLRLATLPRLRCLRAYPGGQEARAELRKRLPVGCELDTN